MSEKQNKELIQPAVRTGAVDISETPEELHKYLMEQVSSYQSPEEAAFVERAWQLAAASHKDQKRKSGEPYIIHPLWVAIILTQMHMDTATIAAALLHDVVEDTDVTEEELIRDFGEEVAHLVDGVTKLGQLKYSKDKLDLQAENLRKMFLAMSNDIRVIIIKLADRLHNMRTMQFMPPHKQQEKSRETLDIYSPLAQRLGISKMKTELDDLAMQYLHPDVYHDLLDQIDARESQREEYIESIIEEVRRHMQDAHIECEVYGRVKHLFSVYKKMVNQGKTVDEILDLFAVRIIVNDVKDCYSALGIIHEMYVPIPGRIKDYIAMPKPNRYQSLHTSVIGKNGQAFEVQIRTREMHRTAEYGIAAHWRYKEQGGSNDKSAITGDNEKITWLRMILEWQNELNNSEFMSAVKGDLNLFSDNVYCFTPQGDVKNLPAGSTPVDFAYSVHTDVGHKMVGARVNGKLVTIDYKIQNGDRLEVITSQSSRGPSRDWLNFVKSSQARNKINQWFKKEQKEENLLRGKEILQSYCKSHGLQLPELLKPEYMDSVLKKYGFNDWDSILAAVGHGGIKEGIIVNRLVEERNKDIRRNITDEEVLQDLEQSAAKPTAGKAANGVIVKGVGDVAVHFSKCCSPVPGDPIIGFITRGRGISVHRKSCVNMQNISDAERVRLIPAEWADNVIENDNDYHVGLRIYANNRKGLVVDISRIFTERRFDITTINLRMNKKQIVTVDITFDVRTRAELDQLIGSIKTVQNVLDVERTK